MPDPSTNLADRPIILASGSRTRISMLQAAGVDARAISSDIDEMAVIEASEPLHPADVAALLARVKAADVEASHTGELVIGADQTLELDGKLFSKPASIEEARRNLLAFRGKPHALHSSAAMVHEGDTVWQHTETAWLTMRDCSPQFIGRYLAAAGTSVLDSVGCYQLEGLGAQLFERIEGDWFTILGLPLLPLLEELRRREVIPS